MPGNLLLGARYLQNDLVQEFAQELLDSCFKAWKNSPTGLAPEGWGWIDDSPAGNISSMQYSPFQRQEYNKIGYIPTSFEYLLRPGMYVSKRILFFIYSFIDAHAYIRNN